MKSNTALTTSTRIIIILVTMIVLLSVGTTFLQRSILPPPSATARFLQKSKPIIPYTNQHLTSLQTQVQPPPAPEFILPEVCKQVDFHWLASDRIFWDGWVSKSMFMTRDGRYTRRDVVLQQGESICITVLLGPIPAFSSIRSPIRYAPSDSIVMTAKSDDILIPITLQQHNKQSNTYFASVQFNHHGIYTLKTSVEYRSYFWELPHLHKYLPNKFSSHNQLTVVHNKRQLMNTTSECNLYKNSNELKDSAWMEKNHYQQVDPIGFYLSEFNSLSSSLVFVPTCQLKQPVCTLFQHLKKTIHVIGDKYLKRNLQLLNRDNIHGDLCNKIDDGQQQQPLNFNQIAPKSTFHFNQIESIYDNNIEIPSPPSRTDIIILGIGNEDVANLRQTPESFAIAFNTFLTNLIHNTRNELIVVKTTQYYGSHSHNRGWTHGRSDAFANIIRSSVKQQQENKRVILWDTHQIGFNESKLCQDDDTMSSHDVIKVENAILANILTNAYMTKL